MQKIILTIGLPGSGKSTWAKKMVNDYPGTYKRINKDDLRAMLDDSKWSKNNEKFILSIRDLMIVEALKSDYSVIIDDTNLDPKHLEKAKQIALEYQSKTGKQILVTTNKDFLNISLETCIKQDLKRFNSVGEKVIRDMYKKYIKVPIIPIVQDEKLPKVILVDIDGTVAEKNDRNPFKWNDVHLDTPRQHVIDVIKSLEIDYKIIFLSGRDSVCRELTIDWLVNHFNFRIDLFMRAEGDQRSDTIVKKELYEKHIENKYFVEAIFDDRNKVVDMWRELGLNCFQVQPGNF